jgi:hypothetical protein
MADITRDALTISTSTNGKNFFFPAIRMPQPPVWAALIDGTTRICDRYNLPGHTAFDPPALLL